MMWLFPLLLAAADTSGSTRSLYLQLIHQARADGRPRAAIAYLDDFDRRYPGDRDARILRVNSLLDLDDLNGAEAAAAALPDGGGSAIRGHLLAARGRWAEAITPYQQAVQASPADPMLRNALGFAQLRAGLAAEAVESLRGALDLSPGTAVIRNNLLLALRSAGQNAEAEALLSTVRDGSERDAVRRQIALEAARLPYAEGPLMFCLCLLLASAPTLPQPDQARRVVEWQLRSPPRAEESTGLSAEEAQVIRNRYLQSIGQPLPRSADQDATTIA